jgi:iron complex transport system substrate-binding protein
MIIIITIRNGERKDMPRKKTASFVVTILFALVLAACGGNAEDTRQTEPAGTSTLPVQTAESTVRSITHLKGTTEIPAKIEKMVVLSAAYIDHLLTIGEKPIGVNVEVRYGGDYLPYLANQLQGVQTLGSADSPNLEAIVLLDPDVILVESRTAESTYEQLNKIAPTLVLGNEWQDYEENPSFWTKDLLTIAEMYDKVELAQQKITELNEKVAQASETIQSLDNKKLAYLRVREKFLQVYAEQGHPTNTLLYRDLGFEPTSLTPADQRIDLSLEKVPDLDADYIVLEVDPNGRDYLKSMDESSLWKDLPAIRQDQVFETDSFWLFKGWGALGRSEIVDEVMKMVE